MVRILILVVMLVTDLLHLNAQELQARIQAEQNMLTNEQTKLQSLYQIAQSEEMTRRQRMREQTTSDIGNVRSLPAVNY